MSLLVVSLLKVALLAGHPSSRLKTYLCGIVQYSRS
jgi:hypothetical protein